MFSKFHRWQVQQATVLKIGVENKCGQEIVKLLWKDPKNVKFNSLIQMEVNSQKVLWTTNIMKSLYNHVLIALDFLLYYFWMNKRDKKQILEFNFQKEMIPLILKELWTHLESITGKIKVLRKCRIVINQWKTFR